MVGQAAHELPTHRQWTTAPRLRRQTARARTRRRALAATRRARATTSRAPAHRAALTALPATADVRGSGQQYGRTVLNSAYEVWLGALLVVVGSECTKWYRVGVEAVEAVEAGGGGGGAARPQKPKTPRAPTKRAGFLSSPTAAWGDGGSTR